jgi:hypothetical protein
MAFTAPGTRERRAEHFLSDERLVFGRQEYEEFGF